MASHAKTKSRSSESKLGLHLRELRKGKGETLHEVSMGTNIDSPMLSKIERGDRMPTLEHLKRLSDHFKVSETELRIMYTAEKIIKEYGANMTTYKAARVVEEQIGSYDKK